VLNLHCALSRAIIKIYYYFQMITDNLKIPIVRMLFLLFYITFILTHFYTYCYSAEKLMAEVKQLCTLMQPMQKNQNFQSTNMAYGVYDCKWYGIPSKNAKDLMLIVYRSTIPLKLTAGKFGILSLEMFGIVRCIYIYVQYRKIYYYLSICDYDMSICICICICIKMQIFL